MRLFWKRLDSAPRGRLVATARRAAEGRAARRTGQPTATVGPNSFFFFVTNLVLSSDKSEASLSDSEHAALPGRRKGDLRQGR